VSRWNHLVLGITMPGLSGPDLLKEVPRTYPTLPLLMLGIHPEDQHALRDVKMGAAGYVTKDTAPRSSWMRSGARSSESSEGSTRWPEITYRFSADWY